MQIILGFLFAVIIAFGAYRARSLSRSGAVGALLVGTAIFGFGGWRWAVLLLGFFISSSLLTRLFARRKAGLNEKFDKGGQRDLGQVLANGGVASVFAILSYFFPPSPGPGWALPPRWLPSMRIPGRRNWACSTRPCRGSSPTGSRSSAALPGQSPSTGAWLLLRGRSSSPCWRDWCGLRGLSWSSLGVALLGGVVGSFFNSFLGATVQAIYRCPRCDKETEKHPLHTCGTETVQVRGWKWLNNDLVNTACALTRSWGYCCRTNCHH